MLAVDCAVLYQLRAQRCHRRPFLIERITDQRLAVTEFFSRFLTCLTIVPR